MEGLSNLYVDSDTGVSGGVRRVPSIDEMKFNLKTQIKEQNKNPREKIPIEHPSEFQGMFEEELDKLGKLEAYLKDSGRL